MVATATRGRLIAARISESYGQASGLKVDRAKGIIFGVKVLGCQSPNTHGVAGASGTRYTAEALQKALPLYENAKVNVDHPPRENPGKDRPADGRLGKLRNVRISEGQIYADLHCLLSHPMTPRLMEAASVDGMADCFALSHNAYGKGKVENGEYVIYEIPEVRSVDLVADGGTTKSLCESEQFATGDDAAVKTNNSTGRKNKGKNMNLLESMKAIGLKPAEVARLWEMDGGYMKPDMAADAMPEAPAGEDEGYELHLGKMIVAIINDASLSPDDKKKKVLASLKLMDGAEPPPETPAAVSEGEGDDKPDDDKPDDDKKKTEESKMAKNLEGCRTLCEALEFKPSAIQLKAIASLPEFTEQVTLIKEMKGAAKPAGPHAVGAWTQESRQTRTAKPADYNGFKSLILN